MSVSVYIVSFPHTGTVYVLHVHQHVGILPAHLHELKYHAGPFQMLVFIYANVHQMHQWHKMTHQKYFMNQSNQH